MIGEEQDEWFLFIHHLPPKPLYLRARIRNLLMKTGAIPLKDAVYLLPLRDELLDGLRKIANVAIASGGEAHVCRSRFVDRPLRGELVAAFRRARDEDYQALVRQIRSWTVLLDRGNGTGQIRLTQATRRLERIRAIDFFESPGRLEAEAELSDLATRLSPGVDREKANAQLEGRTWVTRRGIQVDRIASAWLIRRFIDPAARFRFIDPHSEEPRGGDLTFDMVNADFTHEEDRCTFETLVRLHRPKDAALQRIAEVVHDIDIKDGKFGRPEAKGIDQVLQGLLIASPTDESRLERGFTLFDDLLQSFGGRPQVPPSERSPVRSRRFKGGRQ